MLSPVQAITLLASFTAVVNAAWIFSPTYTDGTSDTFTGDIPATCLPLPVDKSIVSVTFNDPNRNLLISLYEDLACQNLRYRAGEGTSTDVPSQYVTFRAFNVTTYPCQTPTCP